MKRIPLRSIAGVFVLSLAVSPASHAALYQFTVGGRVTTSSYPGVNVDDLVSIWYVADSQDRDPLPTSGIYRATRATYIFPDVTLTSDGFSRVDVLPNDTDGYDRVRFRDFFAQSPWAIVELTFPVGTLKSDALPTALPLASAHSAGFSYWYYPGILSGNVLSFTSVEVPEPGVLALLVIAPLLLPRCFRQLRQAAPGCQPDVVDCAPGDAPPCRRRPRGRMRPAVKRRLVTLAGAAAGRGVVGGPHAERRVGPAAGNVLPTRGRGGPSSCRGVPRWFGWETRSARFRLRRSPSRMCRTWLASSPAGHRR